MDVNLIVAVGGGLYLVWSSIESFRRKRDFREQINRHNGVISELEEIARKLKESNGEGDDRRCG